MPAKPAVDRVRFMGPILVTAHSRCCYAVALQQGERGGDTVDLEPLT